MDEKEQPEEKLPNVTVMKIGRTEYIIHEYFNGTLTLREKLLRLMIKDLDSEM